jgi:hypothetical protein
VKVSVYPDYFKQPEQAYEDIKSHAMHALEMNVPPVENTSHWHVFSTRIYILEGELNITDPIQGVTIKAGPGALVEVPERTLHAELSIDGYNIIAGMSIDPAKLTNPVNLDPDLL